MKSLATAIETEPERVLRWMRGDESAAGFVLTLFVASHAADDVVDGDSRSPIADQALVWQLLFGRVLPNRFFLAHAERFAGAIVPAALNWRLATEWEADGDELKRLFALVLRTTLEAAVLVAADLVGGPAHAYEVCRELREHYHIHEGRESGAAWLAECAQRHGPAAPVGRA